MESQRTFQFTPQVLLMVLLVFVALTLPLAVTSWFLYQHFRPAPTVPPPAESVEIPGLRTSLEAVADSALPTTLSEESNILEVKASDPAAKGQEITAWVQSAGGTTLEMPSGDTESIRLLVSLASSQKPQFLQKLHPDQPASVTSQEPVATDTSLLLDVRILKSK
jgi:hypothetical protein